MGPSVTWEPTIRDAEARWKGVESSSGDRLDADYKVIATCRAPLDRIQWLVEKGCEVVELDQSDRPSVEKAGAQVEKITGGILDILINNASSLVPTSCPDLIGVPQCSGSTPDLPHGRVQV